MPLERNSVAHPKNASDQCARRRKDRVMLPSTGPTRQRAKNVRQIPFHLAELQLARSERVSRHIPCARDDAMVHYTLLSHFAYDGFMTMTCFRGNSGTSPQRVCVRAENISVNIMSKMLFS